MERKVNTRNKSIEFKQEWSMAIYDAARILMARGYLHTSDDVEFVRPGHKAVFPCPTDGPEGPIDLHQLKWMDEKGKAFFCWYKGSYLKLKVNNGKLSHEVIFNPMKDDPWEFVGEIDRTFK